VLDAGSIRAVRLARDESGPRLDEVLSLDLPADRPVHATEIERAGSLADERARVVLGLPARQAALHKVRLPFDQPDKVRRVLRYEAEPYFLDPIDDLVLDFLPLPRSGDRSGLVFGASPEAVAGALRSLEPAGLDPDVVLPEMLGLIQAGERLFRDAENSSLRLLVDLGFEQTGLVLFDGDRPEAARTVMYGGRDMAGHLAESLDLEPGQAETLRRETDPARTDGPAAARALDEAWRPLLVEIERTLAAWLGGRPDAASRAVLCGQGAALPGVEAFLAERLGLPVETLSRFSRDLPDWPEMAPELVVPFGLALAAISPGPRPNLRQGGLAPRQALSRYRGPLALLAVGLILALLLNMGDLYYTYRVQARAYEQIKSEINRVFRETAPGVTKVVAPLAQMHQELQKVRNEFAGLDPGQGRVLDLLQAVSRVAGAHEGLRITNLSLTSDDLELAGEGGSFDVIDRLKNELAALPFFSEAVLGGARMDPVSRVLTFRISLKRKHG